MDPEFHEGLSTRNLYLLYVMAEGVIGYWSIHVCNRAGVQWHFDSGISCLLSHEIIDRTHLVGVSGPLKDSLAPSILL